MLQKMSQTEAAAFPSEKEFAALAPRSAERKLHKGEHLWIAGDEPAAVWLIKEGRVNLVFDGADGTSAVVHFCTRAQTFCPAAVLLGGSYPCSAVAATATTVVAVSRSRFMGFFDRLPALAKGLFRPMAQQLCDAHRHQALCTAPVKTRLATLLDGLHRRYAGRDLPFTRQDLANMCGTTVESTIRTLSRWEKAGVIESARGSIHVRHPRAIEKASA